MITSNVSIWRSYTVIFDSAQSCTFKSAILHNQIHFKKLYEQIVTLVQNDNQTPSIVFEAMDVYSRKLERFINDYVFL